MAPASGDSPTPAPKKGKSKAAAKGSAKKTAPAKGAVEDDSVCQVPGCEILLASMKVYNQRCRVCQEHLLAGAVDFEEQGQKRFCQQCARFHPVEEFDGAKRSCRLRLERHKLQRRKRKCIAAEAAHAAHKAPKKDGAAAEKAPVPKHNPHPEPKWGNLLADPGHRITAGRLRGFGIEELEAEGESMCPSALANAFTDRMRGSGPRFMSSIPRKSDGGFAAEDAPTAWEDFPSARRQRTPPPETKEELPQREDPSFLEAVLMKLHEDLPRSSEDSHLDAATWHGGAGGSGRSPQPLYLGDEGGMYGDGRAGAADWGAAAETRGGGGGGGAYDTVSELGYRNVQECIDGLPFSEAKPFDIFAVPSPPVFPYGGGGGHRPPSRHASGHLRMPPMDAGFGVPHSGDDKLANIMRSLHEEEGGAGDAANRYGSLPPGFHSMGMSGLGGMGSGGAFAPSMSPPRPQGFFSRYH
eukprot:jgi/Tetstr1/435129/TSEL_024097.t1